MRELDKINVIEELLCAKLNLLPCLYWTYRDWF